MKQKNTVFCKVIPDYVIKENGMSPTNQNILCFLAIYSLFAVPIMGHELPNHILQ